MRLLILNAGQANEAVFVLRTGATIVGRDEDSGIYVPNLSLSRRHARIDVSDDIVSVTDLSSKNGTFVNDATVETRTLIPGDKLRCGQAVFTYLDDATLRSPRQQATLAPPSTPRGAVSFAEPTAPMHDDGALRSGLARFFSASTIAWLMDEPTHLGILEVDVTALAVDIGGFARGQTRPEPRVALALASDFFPIVDEIVMRYEGTLESYGPDASFAVWGVPSSRDDDADRAVEAAIELQRASVSIDRRWKKQLGHPFRVHVGLGSGRAASGNVGSSSYVQYATAGVVVDVARAACGAAGPGEILMCLDTARRLQRLEIDAAAGDVRRIAGASEPIDVQRVPWGLVVSA